MTTFTVHPQRPQIDDVLAVTLTGLPPATEVEVHAAQPDPAGRTWHSHAVFATGAGTVDLRRDAPIRGTYRHADPMGLVWSMTTDEPPREVGEPAEAYPITVLTLTARVDGRTVAEAAVARHRAADTVTCEDVTDGGLVGVLWRPDDDAVHPGIVLLGGSEGGMHPVDAALFAAHGYAVLALAYCGRPGLPPLQDRVPLEYFTTALDHLTGHPHVDAARIGITGGSKGGEAALLVAATDSRITAACSVVGSGIVTQGIGPKMFTGSFLDVLSDPTPNWTRGGAVVPFLPNVVTPELARTVADGRPVRLRMTFEPGLDRHDAVRSATIPVERIAGPVLLVSTEDDCGYGRRFHDVAADQLAAHGRPYRHVVFPDAGHLISAPPFGPTTVTTGPGPGVTMEYGGTPEGTAAARAGSWQAQLDFFGDAFPNPLTG